MNTLFKINAMKILGESHYYGLITYLVGIMAFNLTFLKMIKMINH